MDIIFMGTASAAGSVRRDNTYLLLRNRNSCWLIDVGGNPLGKLKQAAVKLDHIRGVILTHFHTDHIYGLPSLLWGMWIGGRTAPLAIYCPETGERHLRMILEGYRVHDWPIRFELCINSFDWTQPTALFKEDDLALSVFPALHAGPAVGVKAEYKERLFVYSSDTRPNEAIRNQPRIDLLVHEATTARGTRNNHTSLEQLVYEYPLDRIGRVIAVHLTDNEPYDDVLAESARLTGGKVSLAEDMLTVAL